MNFLPFFYFLLCIFFLVFFFLRKKLSLCKCEVCECYLTRSWSDHYINLCDWYTHLLQNSPSSTIHIHVLNNTITANPSNVQHMLKTRFNNYPKGKTFSMILGDFLGRGIFNVDGAFWKFQKKMASLELNKSSIRSLAFKIVTKEITQRLVPLLANAEDHGLIVDLQDVFRRFTFDNICRFTFGLDPGCLKLSLPISEFSLAFDLASRLSAERALLPSPYLWKIKRLLNIGSEKKLKNALKLINVLADEMIRKRRSMIKTDSASASEHDLLSRFVTSIDDEAYLRDIIVSFILAGRDTVAAALTTFFWLLSNNPNVDEEILTESNRVMGLSQELQPSFEQLQEMPYLQSALYESMRLYPPVQFDSKYALQEDILPDGTLIQKGARVTYHPYAMGRMKDLWGPDCLEFKPERWLKNGCFTPVSLYMYPVFQAGVRVCLGKEMALLEMKSVVVSLVRRFEMEPVEPNGALRFAPGLTAGLIGGHRVMIRKRKMRSIDKFGDK
ncbi:12-hydroxyjasmonoyl-L-amino acid 12-hydroxylase [Ranunculus cassubicifolius]